MQIGKYLFCDRALLEFELEDNKEGYDNYIVDVNYWYVKEPQTETYPGTKYVDDIYINRLEKNGMPLEFTKQNEVPNSIIREVNNLLERNYI